MTVEEAKAKYIGEKLKLQELEKQEKQLSEILEDCKTGSRRFDTTAVQALLDGDSTSAATALDSADDMDAYIKKLQNKHYELIEEIARLKVQLKQESVKIAKMEAGE